MFIIVAFLPANLYFVLTLFLHSPYKNSLQLISLKYLPHFNESVLFTSNKKVPKTIVIGWKEISRRYEFNDLSWLYDIKFELLNDEYTDKVICVGRDKYQIAERLINSNFALE